MKISLFYELQLPRPWDDGSEERIGLAGQAIFRVRLNWEVLTGSDSGILYDFYYNPSIAKGRLRSFKWKHPDDGHTYVVRFDCDLDCVLLRVEQTGGACHTGYYSCFYRKVDGEKLVVTE